MQKLVAYVYVCFIALSLAGCSGKNNIVSGETKWAHDALEIAAAHAEEMLPHALDSLKTPRSIDKGFRPARDWTSGFFPGILWYLYSYTQEDFWKEQAEKITPLLEKEQYNTNDHDVGFRIYCSYGNGWILTENVVYRKVIIQAANSLATRFNEKTGTLQSWSVRPKRDWEFPVIVDNMMNLELLLEAAKLSGDERLADIAVTHARTTMKYHYRENFSCPHVSDYDPVSGEFRKWDWNNGNDDPQNAVWSRGQSWGLYGFTMMYRETGDKQYLEFAENIADFLINHPDMPEDMVPYWDYSGSKISTVRDASAAAIMASALMELSTQSEKGDDYFSAGAKILKSLASEEYLAEPGTNGNFLIKHATGNFLKNSEIDGTLIYADYYFVEGLLRYISITKDNQSSKN